MENRTFKIGSNSERLNCLDPSFSYSDLSDFELVRGPSLEKIILDLPSNKYEIEKPEENNYSPSNMTQIIWEYLNSRPGKIRHSGSRPDYGENEEKYKQKICNSIKRGMPIELLFMNFSPKFSNPLVSGYSVLPDLSSLLALQHLIDVAAPVREIYEPGIKFVAIYEGGIYQELGKFSDDEICQTYKQITNFAKNLEKRANASGIIKIADGKEIINKLGSGFIDDLVREEKRLTELYNSKKDPDFITRVDDWRKKFALGIINLDNLISDFGIEHKPLKINDILRILNDSEPPKDLFLKHVKELAEEITYKMALDYFAFNHLKYSAGDNHLGIMQEYPEAMPITVRADKKRLSLQLIPGVSMYPHHGITVWTGEKWDVTRLVDLARYPGQFQGVILSGKENNKESPFYYLLKDACCPQFAKPVGPFKKTELFPDVLSKKGYHMLENWGSFGGTDSELFLVKNKSNEKVIIKYSSTDGFDGNGRPLLKKEVARLEGITEMLGDSQKIFPRIKEYYNDDKTTFYAMELFPNSKTVADYLAKLPNGRLYAEETGKITQDLLSLLSKDVYSKGSQKAPEKYISTWHLNRLRQGIGLLVDNPDAKYKDSTEFFKKIFDYKTVKINGIEFLNFPSLLDIIHQNEEEINKRLNPSQVPLVTHGDLYFGNVLRNNSGELFFIDPHGKRPINAVETELGRITLSFFADFFSKQNYEIDVQGDDKLCMYYTGNNEDLILGMSKARDNMLDIFSNHKGIYDLVKDTEDWRSHVLLTEAIHIPVVAASKLKSDPSGKLTKACYITGVALMNNALSGMGLIDSKYGITPSTMELFIPSGQYNYQKERFIKKIGGNISDYNSSLNYITKSLEEVKKYG